MTAVAHICMQGFRLIVSSAGSLVWALVLAFCCLGNGNLRAQQIPLDSLLRQEKSYLPQDSTHAKLLFDIVRRYNASNPALGTPYAEKGLVIAEILPEKKFLATAHSVMGANRLTLADYPSALDHYEKALAINEQLGNIQGMGNNFNNIGLVYYSILDYPKALEFYLKTLAINEKTGNKAGMANTYGNIGNIHFDLKEYGKAIDYYEKALELGEATGNKQSLAGNLVNLGNAYTQIKAFDKALEYKKKALSINEQLGNQSRIANNLSNIGNVYLEVEDYAQAQQYHQRALDISGKINDVRSMADGYNRLGFISFKQGRYTDALQQNFKSLDLAQSSGQLNVQSNAYHDLSDIYLATQRFDSAYLAFKAYITLKDSINDADKQKEVTRLSLQFDFSKREESLKQQQLLTDARLKEQILIATRQQQDLEIKQKAIALANKEKEIQHLAFLKSQADLQFEQSLRREKQEQLLSAENEKKLQAAQVGLQQAQLNLQEKELQTRKTQGWFYLGGLVLLSLLSFLIFRNFLNQRRLNGIIQTEKQKSDELLLNILPAEIAQELKEKGNAEARQFDHVTVLFTDFVNFTRVAEHLSPHELVSELHYNFKTFDEIIGRYGLEKIKTIGDAYMAVSGLPVADPRHAQHAVQAALEIRDFVAARRQERPHAFEIRIGLHSGPVVAGIVGVKKFAYDIWGDTVNTAARMESASEAGKINLSGATYELIRSEYTCTYRGKVSAKNKGEIDMYYV